MKLKPSEPIRVSAPVDPVGTCHRVGCPTKGTVDDHVLIGTPDTFEPYQRPAPVPPSAPSYLERALERLLDNMAAHCPGCTACYAVIPPVQTALAHIRNARASS